VNVTVIMTCVTWRRDCGVILFLVDVRFYFGCDRINNQSLLFVFSKLAGYIFLIHFFWDAPSSPESRVHLVQECSRTSHSDNEANFPAGACSSSEVDVIQQHGCRLVASKPVWELREPCPCSREKLRAAETLGCCLTVRRTHFALQVQLSTVQWQMNFLSQV
jgi:hypothetical protein